MKSPKNLFFMCLVALSAILWTGCNTTGKFVYPSKMSELAVLSPSPITDKKLAIIPFDDYRNDENSSFLPMYLIPLVPCGWAEYERPEAARMFLSINKFEMTPSEDLAKAAAVSFRRSNLFKNAFFSFGGNEAQADYVLKGKLKQLTWKGEMYSYCLSVYGPLLWYIGLPSGESKCSIALDFTLENAQSQAILWHYSIYKNAAVTQGLYYNYGEDCRLFSKIYQDCMNEIVKALALEIKKNPKKFNITPQGTL